MTNTTRRITIERIEDREFEGECSACGRTGLRWIATLSDGTAVGLECAKRVLGYRPAPTAYKWIEHFTPVAEHIDVAPNGDRTVWVMWQRKGGAETRETRNGVLMTVGGVRADWTRQGWL